MTSDQKKEQLKVLYLARWYPHRYDPMPGLFIQRHAEAVSSYCMVGAVYSHVVTDKKIVGYEVDFNTERGVPTARVYYSNSAANFPVISTMIKAYRFFKANVIGIQKVQLEMQGFDIIHVHVLTRLGLIALWYKWFKNKPFLISEHWSRYLPLTGDFKGFLRKWMTRIVVRYASVVTTVTQNLANAMQSHGLKNPNYIVLANVVTEDFLQHQTPKRSAEEKTTFIHVSCFEDKSKNISGLLNVIKKLSEDRSDFKFKLVGDGMDYADLKAFAEQLDISDEVISFEGLMEGKPLVRAMAAADLMVVFSNYENFPVVINESLVLGIPVVSTGVGGIPEFIDDENGRLINAGDEDALLNLLNEFLDDKLVFDNEKLLQKYRLIFSPQTIGRELYNIYRSVADGDLHP